MLEFATTPEDRMAFRCWLDHESGVWARTARVFRRTAAGLSAGAVLLLVRFLPRAVLPMTGGARALMSLLAAALAALVTSLLTRRWSESWTAAVRRRKWESHTYQEATGARRVWADPSGLNVSVRGTTAHWDWAWLADVQSTPDHFFIRVRSNVGHYAITVPRRLGRSAVALVESVRAQLASPVNAPAMAGGAPGSSAEAPESWGREAPGEVRFVLTPAEQFRRLTWDRQLDGFTEVTRLERRKLLAALVLAPVVALLWTPAILGYAWPASIPAVAVTVGSLISVGRAWFTAPERSFLATARMFERLCEVDPVGDRGQTRLWLDGSGVTIEHLEVSQHWDWELISDIDERRDMVYFATSGFSRAVPRRVDPDRVSWLVAGLRAGTARVGVPVRGSLAKASGPLSMGG